MPTHLEDICATLAILGTPRKPESLDTLTHAEVLAPYVERKGVKASVSHGALLFTAGVRELDVSRDCDGWSCVRFDGRPRAPGEAVRIHTRADLDAHVAWVAGEAG